jgi:outer membrane protein assembly factor BamB
MRGLSPDISMRIVRIRQKNADFPHLSAISAHSALKKYPFFTGEKIMLRQLVYTFAVIIVSTALLSAADWTVFHGPNGDNKSPDVGLQKKWDAAGPKLLWTADFIGSGYSGVTVAGDRIYTSGNVGDKSMVFCLDTDGKKIWEQDNGAAHTEGRTYPGTRGTPTIDGDFVYDASALGEVTCYDAKTGEKKWNRNLLKDYNAAQPRWVLGHSVVVEGDNIVCMVGGKALAVALDKKTGKTVLEYANPSDAPTGYMTPYLFDCEGIRVLTVMTNSTVEAYDAKSTKHLFTIPWRNRTGTNCTEPIYRDGNLFLSTGYGYGAEGYKLGKTSAGSIAATKLWHTPQFDSHHHGLILIDDHVYGTNSRGDWMAVNFLTGAIGFTAQPVREQTAVHYADGMIYCLSQDSRTVILWEPKPTEFIERGRFVLPNEADGKSWAHPVVIGGKLYMRHGKYLYCYDVKAQ